MKADSTSRILLPPNSSSTSSSNRHHNTSSRTISDKRVLANRRVGAESYPWSHAGSGSKLLALASRSRTSSVSGSSSINMMTRRAMMMTAGKSNSSSNLTAKQLFRRIIVGGGGGSVDNSTQPNSSDDDDEDDTTNPSRDATSVNKEEDCYPVPTEETQSLKAPLLSSPKGRKKLAASSYDGTVQSQDESTTRTSSTTTITTTSNASSSISHEQEGEDRDAVNENEDEDNDQAIAAAGASIALRMSLRDHDEIDAVKAAAPIRTEASSPPPPPSSRNSSCSVTGRRRRLVVQDLKKAPSSLLSPAKKTHSHTASTCMMRMVLETSTSKAVTLPSLSPKREESNQKTHYCTDSAAKKSTPTKPIVEDKTKDSASSSFGNQSSHKQMDATSSPAVATAVAVSPWRKKTLKSFLVNTLKPPSASTTTAKKNSTKRATRFSGNESIGEAQPIAPQRGLPSLLSSPIWKRYNGGNQKDETKTTFNHVTFWNDHNGVHTNDGQDHDDENEGSCYTDDEGDDADIDHASCSSCSGITMTDFVDPSEPAVLTMHPMHLPQPAGRAGDPSSSVSYYFPKDSRGSSHKKSMIHSKQQQQQQQQQQQHKPRFLPSSLSSLKADDCNSSLQVAIHQNQQSTFRTFEI